MSEAGDDAGGSESSSPCLHEQCSIRHATPTNLPVIAAQPHVVVSGRESGGIRLLAEPSSDDAEVIAARVLSEPDYALVPWAIPPGELRLKSRYRSSHNGVTHLHYRQHLDGIELVRGDVQLNLAADGRVINISSRALASLRARAPVPEPRLTAIEATESLAAALRLELAEPLVVLTPAAGPDQRTTLSDGGTFRRPVPAKLEYMVNAEGAVQLAWNVQAEPPGAQHYWNAYIDAQDGALLAAENWVVSESYSVYPLPFIDPYDGPAVVESAPYLASPSAASPFGWHDTNGVGGAEFTITRGNNVHAYEDSGNLNSSSDNEPDGGDELVFDFAADTNQAPDTYTDASVVNLFYWNNILHDIHYEYGFDEAAGNFQENNYGAGGAGSDSVRAEAQDGGGFNNANMLTLPDGDNPRMQMFLGNNTSPFRDGSFDNLVIIHEYGHGVSIRLTGGPANSSCLFDSQSGGMGEGWSDWWGLVFTATPGDTANQSRTVGNWLFGQSPSGVGIRTHPYTTNMTANPLTYEDIATARPPHGIGTVWCSMLWDVYWALVDAYGFDPDFYKGAGGNNLAMQLVMDGLKLQPCSPTFVEARDAILLADEVNNGGANLDLLWAAFARRGLGDDAFDGGSSSSVTVSNGFGVPTLTFRVVASEPAAGDVLTIGPTSVVVTLSDTLDPTSLDATDLVLSSVTSSTATATASNRVEFFFVSSPVTNQGQHEASIASNSLGRLADAELLQEWSAAFRLDETTLSVTSSVPSTNTAITLPVTNVTLAFNEPIAPTSVVAGALLPSVGLSTGATIVASNEVAYFLSGLDREGRLIVQLPGNTVTDLYGNPGTRFVGAWDVDFGVGPYPRGFDPVDGATTAVESKLGAAIGSGSDVDVFLVSLTSNQLISVAMHPSSNLMAALEVLDPAQVSLGTSGVAAAGAPVVVQGVRATGSGDYALRVSSHGGTSGDYDLRILLGAVFEEETYSGVSNGTIAAAQDLGGVFTAGPTGEAVVVGFADFPGFASPVGIYDEDFETGPGGVVIDNSFGSGNGMWHHTSGRSQDGLPGHSPTGAMYFGQNENAFGNGNYDSGNDVGGAFNTPPIVVPLLDTVSLSFNTLLETESFADWDHAIVDVSAGGSAPVRVLDNFGGGLPRDTDDQWEPFSVDLSGFAGDSVVVRFTFDTFDDILNNFEGWYVDDIRIEGTSLKDDERDLFRFTIPSNRVASVFLQGHDAGALRLDVLDTGSQVVATGIKTSSTVRLIENLAGSGDYFAAVAGEDVGYSLRVQLTPPPGTSSFRVVDSIPGLADELAAAPAAINLDFDAGVRLSSVQSNDLTINGAPAAGVVAGDGDTLSFSLPPLAEGTQDVAIATGAIASVSGTLVEPFSSYFIVDETPPYVASNSIAQGAVVDGYSFVVTTRFSEAMSQGNLGFDDFQMVPAGSSNMFYPNVFHWRSGGRKFTAQYTLVPDGEYEITLFSGDLKFEDRVGHDLDGERLAVPQPGKWSGDGNEGGDFRFRFFADQVESDLPVPFTELTPPGSRVYETSASAVVIPAGDEDAWLFEADPDQTVSVVVEPGTNLAPSVRLLGPLSNTIVQAAATCAGCPVVMHAAPIAMGGTHRVVVGGDGGSTGAYTVRVAFNAIYELEALGGTNNASPVAAQIVDAGVVSLAGTLGEAGTVIGALVPGDDEDWFGATVASNQSLALALAADGAAALQLYDAPGSTLLRSGVPGSNATMIITGFLAAAQSDLRIRVSGSNSAYRLVIARDAVFDVEPNGSAASAQSVNAARAAMGRAGPGTNDTDAFTFHAEAGSELVLETATPGGGPVETRNGLDPHLSLFGPSGALVLEDDNTAVDKKNALLAHVATTSGTYRVEVSGAAGSSGDYILRLNAPPPVHLAVVNLYGDAAPPEGRHNVAVGATLNLRVTNTPVWLSGGTGLVACVGWIGTGDVPGTGIGTETGPLLFSQDSTIAWQWQPVQPGYFQDFDEWRMPVAETSFTNELWSISDGHVWPFFGRHSESNAAWLYNSQGLLPDSHLTTPVFSNGFYALIFRTGGRHLNQLPLDILLSTTGSSFQLEASLTSGPQGQWVERALVVNATEPTEIRFDKPHIGIANTQLGLDDILVVRPFTPVSPDRDADTLPDTWEILHALNHLDDGSGNPVNGPAGDSDGDGADNEHELGAGTDPNDKLSVFAINGVAVPSTGGGVDISAWTQPGRTYSVEFTDDVPGAGAVWHSFTNLTNGVGMWTETNASPAVYTFHDDFGPGTSGFGPASGRRSYRVRVE